MEIRHARKDELDNIMSIFESARAYMRSQGNLQQWGNEYPSRELIAGEIASGHFYCIEYRGTVVGVFSFVVGEAVEPTYATIYDGMWRYDEVYGVIHRLATNGRVRRVSDCCVEWCKTRCSYLRVDTHRDNATMQQALARQGFKRSGIIVLSRNGSERIAYEWHE